MGDVLSGAEGVRAAGSCWQRCQGDLHHVPIPRRTSRVSEAICGCKCSLEGKPELDQEQGRSRTAVSVELQHDLHDFLSLFSFLTGNLCSSGTGLSVCACLHLTWAMYTALSPLWGVWPQTGPHSQESWGPPEFCSGNSCCPHVLPGPSQEDGACTGQWWLSLPGRLSQFLSLSSRGLEVGGSGCTSPAWHSCSPSSPKSQ